MTDNCKGRIKKALENRIDVELLLKIGLEKAEEAIIIVDKNARIVFINEKYLNFIGKPREEVLGKAVIDTIDNTRLHRVLMTHKSEIGEIQIIGGKKVIVSRFPIHDGQEVIGAMGRIVFENVTQLDYLSAKVHRMETELDYYKSALKEVRDVKYNFDNIIGNSEKLKATKNIAERAAMSNSNVLILGESGTGKELFAHAIHAASSRSAGPFIKVNCGAIPPNLLESEIFGYEGGAFTGALKNGKIGKFEMADGGSIFLDEIGDMPLHMQAKILRAIQEKVIERIGGVKNIYLDFRVIAATNRNLEELTETGKFREDLYYRLNVMTIVIPPLRERKDDIAPIAKYLLDKISGETGNYISGISDEAMKHLEDYNWPGNVRELENILERVSNFVEYGKKIDADDLPMHIKNYNNGKVCYSKLKDITEAAEKKAILETLERTNGNRAAAAKLLGISRTSLYEKLWKYKTE